MDRQAFSRLVNLVIAAHFAQPGGSLLYRRGQLIAKPEERSKIIWPDALRLNASDGAQRIGKRLVGSGHPNHSPLADGELHQGEDGDGEYEKGCHGFRLQDYSASRNGSSQ